MWAKYKHTSGFTIVELLIVIVIIGILAAITIIAYNGLQNRAYAAKAEAVVDAYSKLLNMYKVDHGDFPVTNVGVCLGATSEYPVTSDFPSGACFWNTSTHGGYSVDTSFNAALQPYTSSFPDVDLPIVHLAPGVTTRGVEYNFRDSGNPVELVYTLPGDIGCPRGTEGQYPDANGSTITGCVVPLE